MTIPKQSIPPITDALKNACPYIPGWKQFRIDNLKLELIDDIYGGRQVSIPLTEDLIYNSTTTNGQANYPILNMSKEYANMFFAGGEIPAEFQMVYYNVELVSKEELADERKTYEPDWLKVPKTETVGHFGLKCSFDAVYYLLGGRIPPADVDVINNPAKYALYIEKVEASIDYGNLKAYRQSAAILKQWTYSCLVKKGNGTIAAS